MVKNLTYEDGVSDNDDNFKDIATTSDSSKEQETIFDAIRK